MVDGQTTRLMADGRCVSRAGSRIVRSKERNSGRTVDLYEVLLNANETGNCLMVYRRSRKEVKSAEVTLAKKQTRH